MDKSDKCKKCGSDNTEESPSMIELDDGKTEENRDTLNARCLDCGNEWIIVYLD